MLISCRTLRPKPTMLTRDQILLLADRLRVPVQADRSGDLRLLLPRLLESAALTVPERVALGDWLNANGDTRSGVGVKQESGQEAAPDIAWVDIPAGPFLMGSDRARDPLAKDSELPQHTLELPLYRISRYPITCRQYEAFVESDGYTNRQYWTDFGWQWKADKFHPTLCWEDPAFHVSNQPVLGVSWFEAHAFCRWLSTRLGYEVRLPSEAEWEKAARGTQGAIYAYGDSFDPQKCNVEQSGINRPCAVGLFPQGASPFGVMDMSGLVFEWTLSKSRPYPYDASDSREDLSPYGSRVFRGGAYKFDGSLSRAAYRSQFTGHARYDWVGFRVCAPT